MRRDNPIMTWVWRILFVGLIGAVLLGPFAGLAAAVMSRPYHHGHG